MPQIAAGSSPTADSTLNRPPTFSGTGKRRYVLRLAQLPKHAASRIGGEQEVTPRLVRTHRPLDVLPRHEVLGHGLGGRPGLADDVEEGARRIDPLEQAPEGERIGVVHDVEPRKVVAILDVALVPERAQERVSQGHGAEPGASDPQHDDVLEPLAEPVRERHAPAPRKRRRTATPGIRARRLHVVPRTGRARRRNASFMRSFDRRGVDPALEAGRHDVSVVETHPLHHSISTVSPSYAPNTPSGSRASSSAWVTLWVRWVR